MEKESFTSSLVLTEDFYIRDDVVQIARELLGKVLFTRINGLITAGKIVETEAYKGASDKACHAFRNRMTKRNSIMFNKGGCAYVYMIYGIHYLFNIVTNEINKPDAVLIRALEPVAGLEVMMKRRGKKNIERITSGPGSLSKAMGIDLNIYGTSLRSRRIWLEDPGHNLDETGIVASTRIGVDYAGEDANLKWRFFEKNNPWISKK